MQTSIAVTSGTAIIGDLTLGSIGTEDGKCKKLGFERYKHHILYEVNGGNAIVDNVREQDGKTSYQVRTLKQFRFEQTAIKRILDEQKAKGAVTVGAVQRVK